MKNLLIYIVEEHYELGCEKFVEYPTDLKARINELNDIYKSYQNSSIEFLFAGEIHKEFKIVEEEVEIVKSLKLV
jgi:hypothetical protein